MLHLKRISFFAASLLLASPIAGCENLSGLVDQTFGPDPRVIAFVDVTQDQPDLQAYFHGTILKNAQPDDAASEIALTLDGAADAQLFAGLQHRAPDWIRGTHVDGNTAIVVARDDVAFSTSTEANGFLLTITPRIAASRAAASNTVDAEPPSAAPVEPVRVVTDTLRGEQDTKRESAPAGLQRDDLRAAFGN
jgi:hypothetical protein